MVSGRGGHAKTNPRLSKGTTGLTRIDAQEANAIKAKRERQRKIENCPMKRKEGEDRKCIRVAKKLGKWRKKQIATTMTHISVQCAGKRRSRREIDGRIGGNTCTRKCSSLGKSAWVTLTELSWTPYSEDVSLQARTGSIAKR